jgi:hypothetical protein
LWKRRAYPVEISAEQNFGEGQGIGFEIPPVVQNVQK